MRRGLWAWEDQVCPVWNVAGDDTLGDVRGIVRGRQG